LSTNSSKTSKNLFSYFNETRNLSTNSSKTPQNLFSYFNKTQNLSTNSSKTPQYQVSCNLVWHFPRQHKRRHKLRPDNTLTVANFLSESVKNAVTLQFTIIHQQMHNIVFTPSHYTTTLKIPTYSNPCAVTIRQSVHQISLYKTSTNHINLNIFKIMSPVVTILYLL